MADAAWYRAWRLAHPEYRAREVELSRVRKRRARERTRSAQPPRLVRVFAPPPPVLGVNQLELGHPLYARAAEIVGPLRKPEAVTWVFAAELIHSESIQVAVLAMLERRDPRQAIASFRRREQVWLHHTTSLELVADERYAA